jgi:transcription antitermination factor NusG
MSYWAVAQTEPQREHLVRLLLMRAKFETYLPRIKVRQRVQLLFPSYVFIHIEDRWMSALWCPHIQKLLMSGTSPARLHDSVVSELRSREKQGFVRLPRPPATFRPGQRVRIVRGSFEGQFGIYDGMSGKERERVLLDLLGQAVPVVLPTLALASA